MGRGNLPANAIEQLLFQYIPEFLKVQAAIGVVPPIALVLALTGTNGSSIPDGHGMTVHQVVEDSLVLPEVIIDDFSTRIAHVVKPIADLIWNASGWERSPNFDAEGKWSAPKR